MIELVQVSEGKKGNGYDVHLDSKYTVNEFILEIVKKYPNLDSTVTIINGLDDPQFYISRGYVNSMKDILYSYYPYPVKKVVAFGKEYNSKLNFDITI